MQKKALPNNNRTTAICNLPLSLAKVIVLDADERNRRFRKGMVPVKIYIKPEQLAEIQRLKIDLTMAIQDWLSCNTEAYQVLRQEEEAEEILALFDEDERNGDVHK